MQAIPLQLAGAAAAAAVTGPVPTLSRVVPDPDALSAIPRHVAERYRIVPLERRADVLRVAMVDAGDVHVIDELVRIAGCRVVPVPAHPGEIQQAIARLYTGSAPVPGSAGTARRVPESLLHLGQSSGDDDAPVVRQLNRILTEAIDQRASDIHIQPQEEHLYIRCRIDGILTNWNRISSALHAPLVSRVKVLANMDIAERRLPQDGRFTIQIRGRRWDVRVSTVPGVFGEKAVLRILPKEFGNLGLEDLGMQERELRIFSDLLARPYGMVLVTGPTGAGKTTTLYAALQRMDCVGRNVLTIEDPVEYELPQLTQIQVHAQIGLTFAEGLRHILRQDPDVLMVGEIRDSETLEMAVQSALTGHMVLSTLHCNDAAAAAIRCLDMGLEPFLFTSSVAGVVAQRLVRRVCPHCRVEAPLPASVQERFGVRGGSASYWQGRGCSECRQTGYLGRLAVFELMSLNDAIKAAVQERAPAGEIRKIAAASGMQSLREDAVRKVAQGLTTPEEVLQAVHLE